MDVISSTSMIPADLEELIFQQCVLVARMLASELEWMISSAWNQWKNLLVLSAKIPSQEAIKKSIPGFPGGMVSSFLTFVMLTLMSLDPKSSPTFAPSKEMTFPFNHIPPLLPSERILDLSSSQKNTLSFT